MKRFLEICIVSVLVVILGLGIMSIAAILLAFYGAYKLTCLVMKASKEAKMKKKMRSGALLLVIAVLAGCAGYPTQTRRDMTANTAGGAVLGAGAGAAIGSLSGQAGAGAVIGSIIGGVLGFGNTPTEEVSPRYPSYYSPSYQMGRAEGYRRAQQQRDREDYRRGVEDGYYQNYPHRRYRYRRF